MGVRNFMLEGIALKLNLWIDGVNTVCPIHRCKNGLKPVVMVLGNGIEFMIVTSSTLHGQTAKRVERIRNHIVAIEVPRDPPIQLGLGYLDMPNEIPGTCGDKPKPQYAILGSGKKHIAGNLLLDKLPIRFVIIESSNHIVAIRPGIRPQLIFIVTTSIRIFNDVQPVPRPPLTITRGIQQPVNQLFVRIL